MNFIHKQIICIMVIKHIWEPFRKKKKQNKTPRAAISTHLQTLKNVATQTDPLMRVIFQIELEGFKNTLKQGPLCSNKFAFIKEKLVKSFLSFTNSVIKQYCSPEFVRLFKTVPQTSVQMWPIRNKNTARDTHSCRIPFHRAVELLDIFTSSVLTDTMQIFSLVI